MALAKGLFSSARGYHVKTRNAIRERSKAALGALLCSLQPREPFGSSAVDWDSYPRETGTRLGALLRSLQPREAFRQQRGREVDAGKIRAR